jgi:hypothetical protein
MASIGLGILGTLGAGATFYPKETLAATGLRTRSVEDVITGERIPGSSSNRFFQLIGKENKEDAENTIKAAEKASAGKKGLVFVLKLLLKTLFDQQELLTYTYTAAADPNSEWGKHLRADLLKNVKRLKEREDRLLYIIAYSSLLAQPNATQDMRNLLKKIKTEFGLNRPDHEVTNWKNLYVRQPQPSSDITRLGRPRHLFLEQLRDKITKVEEYIKIEKKIKKTAHEKRERSWMGRVIKKKALERGLDPTVSPNESGKDQRGPFWNIGEFLPDPIKPGEQKTINKRIRATEEKEEEEEEEKEEEAAKFPDQLFWRRSSLNTGGRRSRKRKTRKKRKRKRTRKKRKSRRKKQRKSRRKYK